MMDLLAVEAREIGLSLSPSHLAAFETYFKELAAWNQRFNLTTIVDYEEVQIKHLLDSLVCILAFPDPDPGKRIPNTIPLLQRDYELRCADVGSGAGFPGLPLKILFPGLRMTLIEATRKKALFLQHIIELLDLSGIEVLAVRAEEAGQDSARRGQYDLVVARAVAQLAVLAEYCLPLLRVGGRWISQKSDGLEAELSAANNAMHTLGGTFVCTKQYQLPRVESSRYLVIVDKVNETPATYPRRPGMPAKKPL